MEQARRRAETWATSMVRESSIHHRVDPQRFVDRVMSSDY
jgi:hypothetical protein